MTDPTFNSLTVRQNTAEAVADLLTLDSVDGSDGNGAAISFINNSDTATGLSLALGRISTSRVDGATVRLDLGIAPDSSASSRPDTTALLSLINGGGSLRVETAASSTFAVGGALRVDGAATLNGTLAVAGNTTLSGTLHVDGAAALSGTLGVAGDTNLSGALNILGNVGIGTSTPSKALDVVGQAVFRSAPWTGPGAGVAGTTVGFDAANAGGTGFVFAHDPNKLSTRLWLDGDPIIIAPRGGERVRIASTGLALQIAGDFGRDDGPSTIHLWGSRISDVGGVLSLRSGGNVIAFDGADSVAIGLTAPRTPLHVLGRISTGLDFTSAGAVTFYPPDGYAWFHIDNGPAGGRPIGRLRISHGGNPGDNELMSILQDGRIGIATSNPQTRFHVVGNRIRLEGWGKTLEMRVDGTATDLESNGADLYINLNGRATYIKNYRVPSSRSLKEQITALSSDEALAILAGLDPVKFAYKSDGEQGLQVGFIAEEVPDLIATHDRRGIKPIDIVAVLAKVVKDQQKAIASLARQVATAERER